MLSKRHFNRGMKLSLLERFEDIAKRLRNFCSFERFLIRICSQKDHRDPQAVPDLLGSFDPVAASLDLNVHEDQLRADLLRLLNGFIAAAYNDGYVIPKP